MCGAWVLPWEQGWGADDELCRGLCFLPPSLGELLAGSGTPRQAPFHSQSPRGTPSDRLLKGGS